MTSKTLVDIIELNTPSLRELKRHLLNRKTVCASFDENAHCTDSFESNMNFNIDFLWDDKGQVEIKTLSLCTIDNERALNLYDSIIDNVIKPLIQELKREGLVITCQGRVL